MPASNHYRFLAASYLILMRGDDILLLRRHNTGYRDGEYGLPSGHLEKGESPIETAIREAKEEIGVDISPGDLDFMHVLYRKDDGQSNEYIDFFFTCRRFRGELKNLEPNKCDDLNWFEIDKLPENTIDYVRYVLHLPKSDESYSER